MIQYVSGYGDVDPSELLAAVAGDPEIVGAAEALSPTLGAAIQAAAAQRPRRAVLGSSSIGSPLNTFLPVTNGNGAVAAAASVALTATPLRDYKPNGLVIQTDGVSVTVDTITVANIPMLAGNTGQVGADAFKRDAIIPYQIDWAVIPMNQSLIATCTNRHAATACGIWGAVYGKYTINVG
jgi:hypothetical protein